MKPWKSLAIFAAVLVALIAALVAVKALAPGNGTPTPTPTPGPAPLIDVKESELASVTIENEKGLIALVATEVPGKDGADPTYTWSVSEPACDYYGASRVDDLGGDFLYVSALSEVAEKTDDLASFGLDKPSATVTLRLRDGTRRVVRIGDAVPGSTSRYATLDDAGRVVVVSASTYGYASKSMLDLLDTTLPIGGMTAENLVTLQMVRQKDGLDIQFALTGTGDKTSWRITRPIPVEADASRLSTLIAELVAISPSSYVEYEPKDLSKYGLDEPRYTFFLRSATGDVTISIGDAAGTGSAYFLSSAIPAVFEGDFSRLQTVDAPLLSLMNRLVYIPSIWDVSRIDIDIDGRHIVSTLDTTVDQQAPDGNFTLDGKDANVQNGNGDSYFRKFYIAIISKSVERIDLDAKPTDTADIRIVYTLKAGGAKVTLTFAKTDRDGYYVFRDGTYTGFVVNRRDFYGTEPDDLGLLPAYDMLMDAIANAVDGIYATPTPAPTSGG